MTELLFEGLDGGNPLGFLAALGALRGTSLAWPQRNVRMYWSNAQGGWRPCLTLDGEVEQEAWLAALDQILLDKAGQVAFSLADDLTVPCPAYRAAAMKAVTRAMADDRREADFLAAFGTEAVETEANGKKTGEIADTALRTLGGGRQRFLISMRVLAADVTGEHLKKALFAPWQYDDPAESHVMRWDPLDDVRYALRWRNSSGDPERKKRGAVWGANRLAIEALPLLPTAPVKGRLETSGFTQRKGRGVIWTWPIWNVPINMDTARSLLALPELQQDEPDRKALSPMGVTEIYRCQRITQGKYRNFTPAQPA